MIDEERVGLEARLAALEYIQSHMTSMLYRVMQIPKDVATTGQKKMLEQIGLTKFDGLHPAAADHGADELQFAIKRLLNAQREMMGWEKL